jgi:hypothetical protein
MHALDIVHPCILGIRLEVAGGEREKHNTYNTWTRGCRSSMKTLPVKVDYILTYSRSWGSGGMDSTHINSGTEPGKMHRVKLTSGRVRSQ